MKALDSRPDLVFVSAIITAAAFTAHVLAQAPAPNAKGPAFEVASIKRNVSGSDQASVRAQPGGRVTVTNNSLLNIIRNAGPQLRRSSGIARRSSPPLRPARKRHRRRATDDPRAVREPSQEA